METKRYYQRAVNWLLLFVFVCAFFPVMTVAPYTAFAAEEFIATKPEDIVGIWETRFGKSGAKSYMQYRKDGTYSLAYARENLQNSPLLRGKFWFEGTIFHDKSHHPLGPDLPGEYEVRVHTEEDKPVRLSFKMIDDTASGRVKDLTAGMTRVETSLEASSDEIVARAEDMAGVWKMPFLGAEAFVHYKADGTFDIAYTVEMLKGKPALRSPGISGNFWFEDGVFYTKDNSSQTPGSYEVSVQKEGGTPTHLSFRVIEDPDSKRAQSLVATRSRIN